MAGLWIYLILRNIIIRISTVENVGLSVLVNIIILHEFSFRLCSIKILMFCVREENMNIEGNHYLYSYWPKLLEKHLSIIIIIIHRL